MNTWKVVLATLVIFVAGIVTGALLVRSTTRMNEFRNRAFIRQQQMQPQNPPTQGQGQRQQPREPREGGQFNRPVGQQPGQPGQSNALPQFMRREFSTLLEGELRLTPDQREQIERIMAEGQQRIQKVREQIDPELRREMQESRERIREVLTPEQRQRFEQLMKQRFQRRGDERRGEESGPQERRPRPLMRDQSPESGERPPMPQPQPDGR